MTTITMTPELIAALGEDHRVIRAVLLPRLQSAVWDLERDFGLGDEDLGQLRGDVDALQADLAIHLGEEAEFLMPLVERLAAHAELTVDELDRVQAVIAMLAARRDDFDREIAVIQDRLAATIFDEEADDLLAGRIKISRC